MSLIDAKLELSDAQAITGTGSKTSEDIINIGGSTQNPGRGTPLYLNVVVNAAFPSGATTLQVCLQDSADGTTWASKITFAAVALSALATPGISVVKIPLPSTDLRQYLSLDYLLSAEVAAGGKLDAWVGMEAPTGAYDTTQYGWDG